MKISTSTVPFSKNLNIFQTSSRNPKTSPPRPIPQEVPQVRDQVQSVCTNDQLRDGNLGTSPNGKEAALERAICPADEEQPPGPGPPDTGKTPPPQVSFLKRYSFYQPQGWSGNTAGQDQAQVTPDNHDHQTTPTTFTTPPPQTTNLTRDQIEVLRDQT